jgi:excisionase family DNA binding protein
MVERNFMVDKLLTSEEIADYLKLDAVTIRRKAAKGEIPAIKVGKQYRFDKDQVDKWLLQKTTGSQEKILVVDDEPIIGTLFQASLDKSTYQVTTCLDSTEALFLVANNQYDLIFLDLVMPGLDGSELFRHIRDVDESVPVVIITGYPDSDLMDKAMQHGPFLVMKKPFDSEDIIGVVRNFTRTMAARTFANRIAGK